MLEACPPQLWRRRGRF